MPPRAFSLRDFPAGWLALGAAVAGVAVTLGLRLDPMENPDSLAFLALARSLLAGLGFRYQEPLIPGVDLFAFRAPGDSLPLTDDPQRRLIYAGWHS